MRIRSIIGPAIGGALARPCISYPEIFSRGTIWDRFPYLLPNIFSAVTVCFGVIAGLLFLEETHALKKHQRDRGRELGDYLIGIFCRARSCRGWIRSPEKQSLLDHDSTAKYQTIGGSPVAQDDDEVLPAYRSTESSPRLQPQDPEAGEVMSVCEPIVEVSNPKIFTKPVVMIIVSYGILAL